MQVHVRRIIHVRINLACIMKFIVILVVFISLIYNQNTKERVWEQHVLCESVLTVKNGMFKIHSLRW